MNKSILLLIFLISISCVSQKASKTNQNQSETKYQVVKSDEEWKNELTPIQYYVLRQSGTERPFSGEYDKNYFKGTYVCAACQIPLYNSENKYDSKSGWPSFDRGITDNLELKTDYLLGYPRSELKCSSCGGHLGHLFNDGPKNTTGERHCINSAALIFIPKNEE